MVKRISPVVLKELMESSRAHAVLDVRDPMEFHEKQIFMTTNAPRAAIEFLATRLVPVKATPVVCMDEGGLRAERVAELLEECGYADVSVLEGGLGGWEAQGFPTASGTNVPSKDFGERIHVENEVPEITARELYDLIEGDTPPRIFDTRTEVEFERFCVPTGRSLPGGELILHAWDLDQDRKTPLIINCAGRTRSIIGTQALHRLGVTHARALKNGGMGIMLEGLQLEEGKPSEIPAPSEESRAHGEVLGAQVAEEEGIPFVSVEELRELQSQADSRTLYVLDVRLAPEFSGGHIPGAISIPGGQAAQRTDEVIAVRAGKIVTYCDKNARGVMAAYWLRQMGLDVSVLRGGLTAWREAGGGIEKPSEAASGESPAGAGKILLLEQARAQVRSCSAGEASARRPRFGAVLDVDLSSSFERGHLPGSVWVSRGRFEDEAPGRAENQRARVLCVCEDGRKSALSAFALQKLGYRRAGYLEGGKKAWREAGFSLDTGSEGIDAQPKDVQLKPYDIGRGAMEGYLTWEENLGKKYARK